MKPLIAISILFFSFVFYSCEEKYQPDLSLVNDFNKIEGIFNKSNDSIYVINFWATTCPPCLKELPLFEVMQNKYASNKLKTYLINIDDEKRVDKYVLPFLNKLEIKNKVFGLIDEDMSSWTAKVNPEWYGALPYTVIYKGNDKKFFFGAFKDEKDLGKEIERLIK